MNKKLLPRRWLLVTLALTAAAAAGLLAAPAAAAVPARDDPAAVAEAYLQARAAAVEAQRPARILAQYVVAGTPLAQREAALARGLALRQADLGHTLDEVTCAVTITRTSVDDTSGTATVAAHGITTLRWHGVRGPSVEASGVDHKIRLAATVTGWRVTADSYADLQAPALLERAGVAKLAVARAAARLERAGRRTRLTTPLVEPASGAAAPARTIPDRVGYSDRIYYDRDAVKAYADRYALNYNPTYVRFSADCCNFVSQSAYAGHMPQSSGTWESGWWYDKNGTSGTGDDAWSWSWISCTRQINFWVGRRIDWVSSISNVSKGDVIYYDWSGDGGWDHVAVLVGTNSAGQKVIDAHTTDHYRVWWKLGSSSTHYGFGKVRAYWVI